MIISFRKRNLANQDDALSGDTPLRAAARDREPQQPAENSEDLTALYSRYHKALKLFVMTTVKCEQVAEEITQESYLKFLKKQNEKVIAHPRAYLFRTASNLSIDFIRRDLRNVFDKKHDFQEDQVESPHASPEDQAILNQTKVSLEASLKKMPRKMRQVFYYRRYEGYSIQDISNRMNMSERMVYKYLGNALRHLAVDLKGGKR
ncbi:RNA polymerase sigma factor [Kordiimonas sp.]|uniref:RNA polymerase sigma factor n=1 Tax=Kordiimonas sp. TaxID=1970157 RepID=UPI003B5230F2